MNRPRDAAGDLASRAARDSGFRERLRRNPKETIAKEFGVTLAEGHEVHVHEESYSATHLVLPPPNKLSEAEREEARTGAESLEFLRRTLHDPAPPLRQPTPPPERVRSSGADSAALAEAAREAIRRALAFLESAIDENGAWHCIRFNVADPGIPRHFEKPPFVSALCALALQSSHEAQAKAICTATQAYLIDTIEYPGLWRYYRHLPLDLDSSALCSQVVGMHPWIWLGRNVPGMLANRDDDGLFATWVLADDEPDVVATFRVEADPVVNANVVAYLGDVPETKDARRWLETLVTEDRLEGSSKWYPDSVAIYYAITRAVVRAEPALDSLRPVLADRILGLRDARGGFGNVLQTAQAVSALYNIGSLETLDAERLAEELLGWQHGDGRWPELLAFGDQTLKWGVVGQIGHGSEALTTAHCIEALERLSEVWRA
ncbi:MAG: hypothetical protein OXG77_08900 [Chloroflexi bacterium]|nr:hypothetical protein [Chloroflexota bacterium]